uniref:Uncharacterized protein n=1 Tax=Opuntia streptacantha TaxID=393608 RepID=A0A7C9DVS2_OPUST
MRTRYLGLSSWPTYYIWAKPHFLKQAGPWARYYLLKMSRYPRTNSPPVTAIFRSGHCLDQNFSANNDGRKWADDKARKEKQLTGRGKLRPRRRGAVANEAMEAV